MIKNIKNSSDDMAYLSEQLDYSYINRSILQVGARPGDGWKDLFSIFNDHNYREKHIMEVHKPNYLWLKNNARECQTIVHGNILNIADIYPDKIFDAITFWHGPEHLKKQEFIDLVPKVKTMCSKFIIGAPWGKWDQANIKNNPYERHTYHWYPEEWEVLGFDVWTFNDPQKGEGPDIHNVMMGISK